MFKTRRRKRRAAADGVELPEPRCLYELANGSERHIQRLIGEHPPSRIRGHGQNKLEILPVAQGVGEWRRAVPRSELSSRRRDRHRVEPHDGAAATLGRDPRQVKCQAIANVDPGVQLVSLREREGFVHTRLEIKMMPQNAAAKSAGDDDRIARPGAAADKRSRCEGSPRIVTLITSVPSQVFVSPPANATS